ncbi:hypothetical protein ACF059_06475 [Streptomyces sp. NPDC016562]|uniref:hypothetical protein n=1 Tax=Streptomyces sp. NPDC016562 TaxID=3364966 RepID=UPI0037023E70
MPSPPAPSRAPSGSAGIHGRTLAVLAALAALAAALVAAFLLAPRALAAADGSGDGIVDRRSLVEAVREAFVAYGTSGGREFSPGVERVVDYWFRYHVAKAVIAALLLVVLVALGVRLWKAFLTAGPLRTGARTALASAGAFVTALALFSLAVVMANVQGAVAPFSSLLPLLEAGAAEGTLGDTLGQLRRQLADSPHGDDLASPALEVMVGDFARYHAAMAVIAGVVAVALVGASVALWRRRARTASSDRRTRGLLGALGVVSAVSSLAVLVVAVANTTTAADPAPALAAFFDGGW